MIRTIHGVIHGKTIQLEEDLGAPAGERVEVQIRIVGAAERGSGLQRTAGVLANDAEWDGIMAEVHEQRRHDSRREIAE